MNDQQLAAVKQALEALEMVAARTGARWALEQGYAGHLEAITTLKSIISQDALDWMAKNARDLGLDYEPAVQEGRDWSLLEATQESLREHMAEIKRLKAAQPAQKPWVGLTDEEKYEAEEGCSYMDEFYRSLYADNIEAKLKEKNHA